MSFQIGDKVVFTKEYSKASVVFEVDSEKSGKKCLRHATAAEIAAGHRIDHSVKPAKKVELSGNSEELEVLNLIDVIPNCEVSEI